MFLPPSSAEDADDLQPAPAEAPPANDDLEPAASLATSSAEDADDLQPTLLKMHDDLQPTLCNYLKNGITIILHFKNQQ